MRISALLCCVTLAVGCAPAEEQPATETPAAAPAISLADMAGTWEMSTMAESSDSVLVTYEMVATADTTGWMVTFPGMAPVAMTVSLVDGDSVVSQMGPYPSALRSGMTVTTQAVSRLVDGAIQGTFVARYQTEAADSVLHGRIRGTRKVQ
jgi:hypothetical protein